MFGRKPDSSEMISYDLRCCTHMEHSAALCRFLLLLFQGGLHVTERSDAHRGRARPGGCSDGSADRQPARRRRRCPRACTSCPARAPSPLAPCSQSWCRQTSGRRARAPRCQRRRGWARRTAPGGGCWMVARSRRGSCRLRSGSLPPGRASRPCRTGSRCWRRARSRIGG